MTDSSNRTATSTALTVSFSNTGPSVVWSTPNNSSVSGVFTISASARTSSTGSAFIKKWCLTVNGSAVASNVAVSDSTYSRVRSGTFDADTGCWSSSPTSLTTAQFRWDSTSWANGSNTYVVTVTDSSNRTATSTTLTVTRVAPPTHPSPGSSTPVVSWDQSNNISVTGVFTLSARAAGSTSPSSFVNKWCLTVNGVPVSSNVALAGSDLQWYGSFNAETGCWTRSSSLPLAPFQWDSTSWANGSNTYVVTVTDSSNRTATSAPLTINTVNYAPVVEWSTANNSTVTGSFRVTAVAAPEVFGTAFIRRWCLTVNGVPVSSNVALAGSDLQWYGSFNAETGCWTRSSSLPLAPFLINTAAWTNATRVLSVVVTDSSNRVASATLNFTTNNPQPTTQISGLSSGGTVQGETRFGFEIYHPGASEITSWCVTVLSMECTSQSDIRVSTTSSTSSRSVSFNTSMWRNGTYSARTTATDSAGRTFDSGTISFNVNNPAASVSRPTVTRGKPKWSDKTVKSTVSMTTSYASQFRVFWGTSKRKLKSELFWASGSEQITLSGLKPKTVYFLKVQSIGPNGSTESSFVKFTTASIPPKPKPRPSSGGSGGSSGGFVSSPCSAGSNWSSCISYLGREPDSYDCSGEGRRSVINSNWWILYFVSGIPVLSKSYSSCR